MLSFRSFARNSSSGMIFTFIVHVIHVCCLDYRLLFHVYSICENIFICALIFMMFLS